LIQKDCNRASARSAQIWLDRLRGRAALAKRGLPASEKQKYSISKLTWLRYAGRWPGKTPL